MTDEEQAQAVLEMLASRKWAWADADGIHTMTDNEILRVYYDHWRDQMYRALRQDEVNTEACIRDFVMVHWAKELR